MLQEFWWLKQADPATQNLLLTFRIQAIKIFLPIAVGLMALYGAWHGWTWLWAIVLWEAYEALNGLRYVLSLSAHIDGALQAELHVFCKWMIYIICSCVLFQFVVFLFQVTLMWWLLLVVLALGVGATITHLVVTLVSLNH